MMLMVKYSLRSFIFVRHFYRQIKFNAFKMKRTQKSNSSINFFYREVVTRVKFDSPESTGII